MSPRSFTLGMLALATCVATALVWQHVQSAPLVWTGLVWTGLALGACFGGRRGARRPRWLYVAAVLAALTMGEGLLWLREVADPNARASGVTMEGDYARPDYFFVMPDPVLGYRPRTGVAVRSIKKYRGAPVYDVTYTVQENGLRLGPPDRGTVSGCVLFFGDSYAWGEGVRDDETTAYQLGTLTGGKYRIYNFAFTGYGPQQMLSAIERGFVRQRVDCPPGAPVHVIYTALPQHVRRAAGLGTWDLYGPRYLLTAGGRVERHGRFDAGNWILDDRVFLSRDTLRWLARIKLYQRTLGAERRVSAFDHERYYAMVAASHHLLARQLPMVRFHVLLWDDLEDGGKDRGRKTGRMHEGLLRHGLPVYRVERLIPNYLERWNELHIAHDGHPTPAAHRLVAQSVERILAGVLARR